MAVTGRLCAILKIYTRGGGAKVAKLINVEVGINMEGGIFL